MGQIEDFRTFYSQAVLDGPALATVFPTAPIRYNFDAGYTAPEALPIDELRELAPKVLDDPAALGYVAMHYDPVSGEPIYGEPGFSGREEMVFGNEVLRNELASWIGRRQNVSGLTGRQVILTSGATQALALAAAAFINPGEGAIVESLTFAWAFRSLKMRGADVRTVDIDDNGLVIESLVRRLEQYRNDGVRPKLLYTIPTFHLPTGSVMPLDRRRQLLEVAEEWNLIVVEDAIYSDLRLDGPPLPPSLLSLDTTGRVLQAHAFSKIIATGLRLGWMAGQRELIEALGVVREDLGVSQWISRIAAEFMRAGYLDPQIERARQVYRQKRDLAVHGLEEACGELVHFLIPHGGIFMWVNLDGSVDWDYARARAASQGVAVRDATAFSFLKQTDGPRSFRLCYGHASHREIAAGTAILGAAIRESAVNRS